MIWESEEIPNKDFLFMRAHINNLIDLNSLPPKGPHPNIFREHGGAMSTDWDKYSTAEETRGRKGHPELYQVVKLNVGEVREIEPLMVKHEPEDLNRAHTNVYGISQRKKYKKTAIRVKLSRIANWVPFED
ncbi:MAG: hypothetical protein ACTSVY_09220 [Candidatus Helarchaeota archaeon]